MHIKRASEQFLTGYFASSERSAKTHKAYECDLRQFRCFLGRNFALRGIGPEHVEGWAAHLKQDGYAPTSIQRKLIALKVFFKYWMRRGVIDQSPFWRVSIRVGTAERLPRTLTSNEVRDLILEAKNALARHSAPPLGETGRGFIALRNLTMIEMLFGTGLRVGELIGLRLGDYRAGESAFLVRGKGNRQRLAFISDPNGVTLIEDYLHLRRTIATTHEALFVNQFRGAISTQGVANMLAQLAQAAGIRRRVTPHMLRHTIATLLLRNGVDIRVVQEFLGHASITTTQRYTHVDQNQLRKALGSHHPRKDLL